MDINAILKAAQARLDRSIKMNFEAGGRPNKWKPSARAMASGKKTLIKDSHLKTSCKVLIESNYLVMSSVMSYAAVHNFGIAKDVKVPAHQRTIKQVWGRPIMPKTIDVKQHTRHMVMPKREFLMVQDSDWEHFAKIIENELQKEF